MKNTKYQALIHDYFGYFEKREYQKAVDVLYEAVSIGEDDFSLVEHLLGTAYIAMRQSEPMFYHYRRALQIDSCNLEARINLYIYYRGVKDTANMRIMRQQIAGLAPWFNLDN